MTDDEIEAVARAIRDELDQGRDTTVSQTILSERCARAAIAAMPDRDALIAKSEEYRKGMNFYFNLANECGKRADEAEAALDAAVMAEREACAVLAEAYSRPIVHDDHDAGIRTGSQLIATAIRSRPALAAADKGE